MGTKERETMPAALGELLKKAKSLLGEADSSLDKGRVVSIENLLGAAIESEMDVAKLRRLSLLLSEFERFYRIPATGGPEDLGATLLESTPFEVRLTLVPARGGGRSIEPSDVLGTLKAAGVTHGLREEAIRAACECAGRRRETVHRLVVAVGEPAQDGEDGSISFAVKAFDKRAVLDVTQPFFGDLTSLVEEIKAGALVARVTPSNPGRPGRDVHGNAIPAVPGMPLAMAIGEGLQLMADGRELHALIRGSLVVGEDALDVVPFHVVDGQLSVGQDIAFDGDVIVTGHVSGPVRIQARDVYVAGNADAASISATGDVWVGGAIQAKAVLEAEGRVVARSASDATVRAIGDVFVLHSLVECRIASSSRVVSGVARGAVEGGEVSAFRAVVTHDVGSSFGVPTTIRVGVGDLRGPLIAELEKRIQEDEATLVKVEEIKRQLARSSPSPSGLAPDQLNLYVSVLRKEIQALEELRGLRRRRRKLDGGREDGPAPSLTVAGSLHPPVTVEIGETSQLVRERVDGGVLSVGPDRRLLIRPMDGARSRSAGGKR